MKQILLAVMGLLISGFAFANMQKPTEVRLASEARNFLESREAGFQVVKDCKKVQIRKKKSKTVCTKRLDFNVLLAVKKPRGEFVALKVDGKTCESLVAGFKTTCQRVNGRTNGVNTEFEVVAPVEYRVHALRRVVKQPHGYREVVYTPYTDFMNTLSVRQHGMQYLNTVIDGAYKDLAKRNVRSLVNKDAFVHERVPKIVVRELIVVEHLDPARFAKESTSDLIKEVYTITGVNQEIAYRYTISSAKARGLLQVIPSTYEGLRRSYPKAGLDPNFARGMTDHRNAAKAAILLADHDVGVIPSAEVRSFLFKNPSKYRDYVASAYNGGPSRAMSLLLRGKDHVHDNANDENRMYVAKIRAVSKISSFTIAGF